jgi:hypothetical protein
MEQGSMGKNLRFVINFSVGTWDSWGFGINYCNYENAFVIEFIHWYFIITVWRDTDVRH